MRMDSLAASPTHHLHLVDNVYAETRDGRFSSVQHTPATPVAMYTSTSARCWCELTITLRTDGYWWHGAKQGVYCREVAS